MRPNPSQLILLAALFSLCWGCASDPAPTPTPCPPPVPPPLECIQELNLGETFATWQILNYHELKLEAESLSKASTDPVASLLCLREQEELSPAIHGRVLEALSLFPDERSHTHILAIVQNPEAGVERHKAINGFARGWPQESPQILGHLLTTDTDPQIRLTAASALGSFCGEEGRTLIKQAVDLESEAWVREKMIRYATPFRPGPKPKLPVLP